MKKSLVALAVAAALPAFAQAQTNVQLTGSVDGALESVNKDANGTAGVSDLKVTNGVWSGSRFAIVGSEDLGGGLRGLFNIEHRLNVDDGTVTAGATFWQGQTWVGLGGGFGTLQIGRNYTPVFRALAVGDTTGYSWYNNSVGLGGSQIRFGNSLFYVSPRLGGFTVHASYTAGENYAAPVSNKRGDALGVAGVGAFGPVSVGVGFHSIEQAPGVDKRTELAASLGAKFGGIGLGGSFAVSDNGAATNAKTKGIFFSASAALGAGTVYLTALRNDPDGDDNNNTGFGLTYSHGLSKRTFVYAAAGLNKQQVAGPAADLKPRKIAVGVRHFF